MLHTVKYLQYITIYIMYLYIYKYIVIYVINVITRRIRKGQKQCSKRKKIFVNVK